MEIPKLKEVRDHFLGTDLVIIGVAVNWGGDTLADLQTFRTTQGITWTLVKGTAATDTAYDSMATPSLILIDTTGWIRYSHLGDPGSATLISEIETIPPPIVEQPPVASFVWSPMSPNVGDTVTFDASGSSDPDGTIVSYAWDFGDGTPAGSGVNPTKTYTAAGTFTVTLTVTDSNGLTDTEQKAITVGDIHDIAVTDVTASPTTVIVGNPVSVEVDVLNEGTAEETFNVNTYYDSSLIGTMSVTLSAGASTTLTFTWNTAGVSPGTYTVKAEVPPVTGETHIADNVFIDGKVTIKPVPVDVDIKPGSCPNPINVGSKGVFAVAIKGTKDFNVRTIDPATVKIYIAGIAQGVPPIRWSYEDVAIADGYLDIVFHFDTQTVVTKLGLTGHMGETFPLIIKGNLYPAAGGLPIQGQDNVWILPKS